MQGCVGHVSCQHADHDVVHHHEQLKSLPEGDELAAVSSECDRYEDIKSDNQIEVGEVLQPAEVLDIEVLFVDASG